MLQYRRDKGFLIWGNWTKQIAWVGSFANRYKKEKFILGFRSPVLIISCKTPMDDYTRNVQVDSVVHLSKSLGQYFSIENSGIAASIKEKEKREKNKWEKEEGIAASIKECCNYLVMSCCSLKLVEGKSDSSQSELIWARTADQETNW